MLCARSEPEEPHAWKSPTHGKIAPIACHPSHPTRDHAPSLAAWLVCSPLRHLRGRSRPSRQVRSAICAWKRRMSDWLSSQPGWCRALSRRASTSLASRLLFPSPLRVPTRPVAAIVRRHYTSHIRSYRRRCMRLMHWGGESVLSELFLSLQLLGETAIFGHRCRHPSEMAT